MTSFQGHRPEQMCLVAVVAILAAIAVPKLLEAQSVRTPAGLAKLCEAANAGSRSTAALDSEAAASFHGSPRFEKGAFLLDRGGAAPYPAGRVELAAPTGGRVVLERGDGLVAIERSPSHGGRAGLAAVTLVIAGLAFLLGRDLAGERRGVKRAAVVLAVIVLNPCVLLPLNAFAAEERVELRGGDVSRVRSWFGAAPTVEPIGRLRAAATARTNGVWLAIENPLGVRPEPLCQLAAHDPRLDATLLEALAR